MPTASPPRCPPLRPRLRVLATALLDFLLLLVPGALHPGRRAPRGRPAPSSPRAIHADASGDGRLRRHHGVRLPGGGERRHLGSGEGGRRRHQERHGSGPGLRLRRFPAGRPAGPRPAARSSGRCSTRPGPCWTRTTARSCASSSSPSAQSMLDGMDCQTFVGLADADFVEATRPTSPATGVARRRAPQHRSSSAADRCPRPAPTAQPAGRQPGGAAGAAEHRLPRRLPGPDGQPQHLHQHVQRAHPEPPREHERHPHHGRQQLPLRGQRGTWAPLSRLPDAAARRPARRRGPPCAGDGGTTGPRSRQRSGGRPVVRYPPRRPGKTAPGARRPGEDDAARVAHSLRLALYHAAAVTISLKGGAYVLTGSVGLLSDALESVVNRHHHRHARRP